MFVQFSVKYLKLKNAVKETLKFLTALSINTHKLEQRFILYHLAAANMLLK